MGSALMVASPTEAMDRTNMEGPADDREAAVRSRDEVERRAAIVGDGRALCHSLRFDWIMDV